MVFALALLLAAPAGAQITDFCPLLEGRIIAGDGQFLGRITPDTVANDSLVNRFGPYGSQLSSTSIFNQNSYGSVFEPFGPFNPNSTNPPRIERNSQPLARLTVNVSFADRVDPNALVAWLRSPDPGSCSGPTEVPTATPTATPEDTPTETPVDTATPVPPDTPTPTLTRTGTPTDTATITQTPTQTGTPTETHTPTPSPTLGPCYGDCDFDGSVRINELIFGVAAALGDRELEECASWDINQNLKVDIAELIRGVRNALAGCVPILPPTPTPSRTSTMPTATPSETRTPTVMDTPTASPTATVAGQCPVVTPSKVVFRTLAELADEEVELLDEPIDLVVDDERQRHGVSVTLSSCADDGAGSLTVRIESPGIADRSFTVPVESVCGEIADATDTVTYDLPVGTYPLRVFVSGSGRYTGGDVSIGPAPLVPVANQEIFSAISLVAGEFEVPDLGASFTVGDECGLVEVAVTMVAGDLSGDGAQYELRIVLDGTDERVSPLLQAGSAIQPSEQSFAVSYQDLAVGEHSVALVIHQIDAGPVVYERASMLQVRAR